jgi:dihydroorotate dehydrogenase (NAD+) catalytic subunit
MTDTAALATEAAGLRFQNPVLLASGTAAYGRELDGVIALDALGGLVTKATSPLPRAGAPAMRVAEFGGGMLNAVGLANPGLEAVRRDELPWLAAHLREARVLVNVVGDAVEDYATVVRGLTDAPGVHGFELNVSCPNVKAGGMEFGADPRALAEVVRGARASTERPLFVKLSPALEDIGAAAKIAIDAGADAITVINTMPGTLVDVSTRKAALGFGRGGVSGPGLLPIGVLAVRRVRAALPARVPVCGVGGIASAEDALQYVMAGATLVQVGTAAMRDPRVPERIVRGLAKWCARERVARLADLVGCVEWPA